MADPHSFKEWCELAKKKAEETFPSIDKDLKATVKEVPVTENRDGVVLVISHKKNPKITWNQAIINTMDYINGTLPGVLKSAYESKKNA